MSQSTTQRSRCLEAPWITLAEGTGTYTVPSTSIYLFSTESVRAISTSESPRFFRSWSVRSFAYAWHISSFSSTSIHTWTSSRHRFWGIIGPSWSVDILSWPNSSKIPSAAENFSSLLRCQFLDKCPWRALKSAWTSTSPNVSLELITGLSGFQRFIPSILSNFSQVQKENVMSLQ